MLWLVATHKQNRTCGSSASPSAYRITVASLFWVEYVKTIQIKRLVYNHRYTGNMTKHVALIADLPLAVALVFGIFAFKTVRKPFQFRFKLEILSLRNIASNILFNVLTHIAIIGAHAPLIEYFNTTGCEKLCRKDTKKNIYDCILITHCIIRFQSNKEPSYDSVPQQCW